MSDQSAQEPPKKSTIKVPMGGPTYTVMMPGDDSPSFETGQIIAKSLTEFLEGFIEARLGAFLTNSFWEKGLQPGGPPPPPHGFPRLEEIKLNLKLDGKGSVALLGVGGGELSGGCSVELTFKRDHSKQQ